MAKAKYSSPTDKLIEQLMGANNHRIQISHDKIASYQGMIQSANRYK